MVAQLWEGGGHPFYIHIQIKNAELLAQRTVHDVAQRQECVERLLKKKSLFLYSFGDGYGHFHSYLGCAWLGLKMENNKQPGNKVQIDRKFRSFRQKKKRKKLFPKALIYTKLQWYLNPLGSFLFSIQMGFLKPTSFHSKNYLAKLSLSPIWMQNQCFSCVNMLAQQYTQNGLGWKGLTCTSDSS